MPGLQSGRDKLSTIGLLQAAAVLTVTFSLVTGLDIPHRIIELFSHYRFQYFVMSALLLIVFTVLRSPTYAVPLLLATGFNASFVLPWYFDDSPPASGAPLKLVHANVLSSNTNYQRLIDLVRTEDPDIVFLQEITAKWVDGSKPLLSDYPHLYVETRRGNFGIAVYSKVPFESISHVDSPPLSHPTVIAKMAVHGEPLTFISTHPTIPIGRFLYESRNRQMQSVAELVEKTNGEIVLLGDFNASVWDVHYRKLEAATGLRNVRKGFGILPSWPAFLPVAMIPIDHILVSEGVAVIDTKTGKRIGSDHLPLVVTISM